jgi:3-(3-hydroxy-phenyl)propionate hydroxylase
MLHMHSITNISVVIVGAGPTGLAAANLLGLAGIDTVVLERNAGLSDCPKAISIDDEGLRICQAMGLGEEVLAHVLLDMQAYYRSGTRYLARVAPTGKRNGYPFISTFHQPTLEALLLQGLARFPHVQVRFEHSLEAFEQDEEGVTLAVRATYGTLYTLKCAYLLACDGASSPVRHALGVSMQPVTFRSVLSRGAVAANEDVLWANRHTQRWLVVDCEQDDDPSPIITFFCNPARSAVTVLAPGGRRRWEFMLMSSESEAEMLQTATIHTLIKQGRALLGREQGPMTYIVRKAVYTFQSLIASSFVQGRVFLLGDAAHLMPPFGGQGMNSGLRDAHNLCWKLALVLHGQMHPSLLASYQQERYPHVAQMILFSSFLGQVVMPTSQMAARLRDLVFGFCNLIPPLRAVLTEGAIKPQPRYTEGLLIADPMLPKAQRSLIGQFLPQPFVEVVAGATSTRPRVLLDEVLGGGFALLWFSKRPESALPPLNATLWQRLHPRFVQVQPAEVQHVSTSRAGSIVVRDSEHGVSAFLRNNPDLLILVRPDRYIMGVTSIATFSAFEAACEAKFRSPRI